MTKEKEFMTLLQEFIIGFLNDARRQGFAIILLVIISGALAYVSIELLLRYEAVQNKLIECKEDSAAAAAAKDELQRQVDALKLEIVDLRALYTRRRK